MLLALTPLIGAALIAISRCEDYRHDVYDVTVGSILGILVTHFTYRRYYPGLWSSRCDVPFPDRMDPAAGGGVGKLKDEEQRLQSVGAFSVDDSEEDAERVPLRDTSRRDQSRSSSQA